MSERQLTWRSLRIVLRGDFNPKIFQPAWFSAEGLIQRKEAETAEIKIIHPDVVDFDLDWLKLQVTRDRFALFTSQEPYEAARDLVLGTFRLLRHSPVRMMGINIDMHFRMKSEDDWHYFGHRLAPKELWEGLLDKPGMRSLTVEEGVRRDGRKGYLRVTVGPSLRVHPGVHFDINDHHEVDNSQDVQGSDEIMSLLETRWASSIKRSEEIIYSLLERHETCGL